MVLNSKTNRVNRKVFSIKHECDFHVISIAIFVILCTQCSLTYSCSLLSFSFFTGIHHRERIPGKMDKYLQLNRPEMYKKLVEAHIIWRLIMSASECTILDFPVSVSELIIRKIKAGFKRHKLNLALLITYI